MIFTLVQIVISLFGMIVTLDGRMGMGKTITMTSIGVEEHFRNGKKIFSTYHLSPATECRICGWTHSVFEKDTREVYRCYNGEDPSLGDYPSKLYAVNADDIVRTPQYTYLTMESFYRLFKDAADGLIILSNCVFLVDEAYLFADSRRSSSKSNQIINAFTMQTRKRHVDMYLTAHNVLRLDKRIRDAIDIRISCRYNPRTKVIRARMRDMHSGFRRTFQVAMPKVAGYYDTDEIVVPTGKLYRMSDRDLA